VSGPAPLTVLDLVPITSGATAGEALHNAIDLAQKAESFGYSRYWFAEHHLNAGVAGSNPAVVIALVASATGHIRLGSGGVQSGHRTALTVVEEFGLIDALYPGRLDLGLGRSGGRSFLRERFGAAAADGGQQDAVPVPAAVSAGNHSAAVPATAAGSPAGRRASNGLVIPPKPSLKHLVGSTRLRVTAELLQQANAESADFADLVRDIVGLLKGTYRSEAGFDPAPVPGRGADVQVWVLGSSGGPSAAVAGELALRFAASYHINPSTVLEAIDAYRAAFVASPELPRPYVAASADVVVGPDDDTARDLASGYARWVLGIRRGEGAVPFPTPAEASAFGWTDEDRKLVADRIDTQFVGSPSTVVGRLRQLQEATGADELVITTITHDHADRVRSYQLLAEEWFAAGR